MTCKITPGVYFVWWKAKGIPCIAELLEDGSWLYQEGEEPTREWPEEVGDRIDAPDSEVVVPDQKELSKQGREILSRLWGKDYLQF